MLSCRDAEIKRFGSCEMGDEVWISHIVREETVLAQLQVEW